MEPYLSPEERKLLLDLAFEAVKATAERSPAPQVALDQLPDKLCHPAATFVTLSLDGALRGCIGTTKPQLALAHDVVQRARSAASNDPRFPAITPEEVPDLEIEISVLTAPQPLKFSSPEQLLESLKPGIDGVIIQRGLQRATFLPQVWERVSDPKTFLELLCQKASLHRNAWRSEEFQVETYQVESFQREPKSISGT
ncbi:MAG: AmmeMemoRadiSam system protein A [Anaerolineales bacterium]|nr:MAG: AmmeMemoRadiSam system protein A [Anaerolineales bacterium]